MQPDGAVPASAAQLGDQPLGLAERIDPDGVCALWEAGDRGEEPRLAIETGEPLGLPRVYAGG